MAELKSSKINIKIDYRILIALLIITNIITLFGWSPWNDRPSTDSKKISVVGETTLNEEPDQYTFNPYFEAIGADKNTITNQVTTESTNAVDKIKTLGVEESDITINAAVTDNYYFPEQTNSENQLRASVSLTIRTKDKVTAQKTQDILVATSAKGQISPYGTFSRQKQTELESTGRDEAIKDARSKAERTASQLDASLGEVIEIKDVSTTNDVMPYATDAVISSESSSAILPIATGKQELRYTIEVIYHLK